MLRQCVFYQFSDKFLIPQNTASPSTKTDFPIDEPAVEQACFWPSACKLSSSDAAAAARPQPPWREWPPVNTSTAQPQQLDLTTLPRPPSLEAPPRIIARPIADDIRGEAEVGRNSAASPAYPLPWQTARALAEDPFHLDWPHW